MSKVKPIAFDTIFPQSFRFKSLMSKVKLQYFQYIYTTYFKKLQEILGNLIKKFVDIKTSKISINTII